MTLPSDSTAEVVGECSPSTCHLVRLGKHGQVGRCGCEKDFAFRRHQRVVCRTGRGVEVGHYLGMAKAPLDSRYLEGQILRPMAAEDEMLWGYLQELGDATQEACQSWLQQQGIGAVLLDVEPLLDGKTLYFHFLETVDQQVQVQLDELVRLYEEQVRKSDFARLLEQGCGPGCGTASAARGCSTAGACGACAVAKACRGSPP